MKKSIDLKAALQFGWQTLRDNFILFIKLLVVLIVASLIPAMLLGKIAAVVGFWFGLPFQFLNLVWQAALAIGALKICLKLYDRQPVDIPDLWSGLPLLFDYLIVKVLFTLIVSTGILLLVIPGLIWMVQFYMASYLVVDRGAGAIAALKGSSTVTYGAKWDLGIFASVMLLVNIVGLVFVGVGLLITLPVTMLASVYVYRELLRQTEASGTIVEAK